MTDNYYSLCVPSSVNAYSIAISFMEKWFISKFQPNFFKNVHIDGKHVFDDARQFDRTEVLKKLKPNVVIQPQVIFDYDREKVDSYIGGIDTYIQRSMTEDAFFRDVDNNIHIGTRLELLQMNFNFRIRVSSKARQMDLYKYMQLAFRIGYTQKENLDIDFHIPYELMLQIAHDAGFEIRENKIVNPIKFVQYLNRWSYLPILYKFRAINGKNEFFLRMKDLYTHISTQEQLNADDGEREGMLYNNYMIDMSVVLKMPVPKFYMYMSPVKHEVLVAVEEDQDERLGVFNQKHYVVEIPERNEKNWKQYIYTEYYEENIDEPISIDFKELFEESELLRVIRYNTSINISSSIFLDIKLFNEDKIVQGYMDWETLVYTTKEKINDTHSFICIYVDLEYMNKTLIDLDEAEKNRLL